MPFDLSDLPSGDPLEASFEDVTQPKTPVETPQPASADDVAKPIVQKLDEINGNINNQQLLQTILGVPEVQEVLRARQAGQAVKVLAGNQQQQAPQPQPEPDWDSMKDDPKKLTDTIIQRLTAELLPKLGQAVDEKINPIAQKMSGYESHMADQTRQSAMTEVAQLKAKYQDVDAVAPLMKQINGETNGTLKLEEVYHLAKIRSGTPMVPPQSVATERPTDSAARNSMNQNKQYGTGRRGFNAALNDALSNLKIEQLFEKD
jgi:hypothetical protein